MNSDASLPKQATDGRKRKLRCGKMHKPGAKARRPHLLQPAHELLQEACADVLRPRAGGQRSDKHRNNCRKLLSGSRALGNSCQQACKADKHTQTHKDGSPPFLSRRYQNQLHTTMIQSSWLSFFSAT